MAVLSEFRVVDSGYRLRPASTLDDFHQIASILYQATPQIFREWLGENRDRTLSVLSQLCQELHNFFSFDHLAVAEKVDDHKIYAVANIIGPDTRVNGSTYLRQHFNFQFYCAYRAYWTQLLNSQKETRMLVTTIGNDGTRHQNSVAERLLLQCLLKLANLNGYTQVLVDYPPHDSQELRRHYMSLGLARHAAYTQDELPVIASDRPLLNPCVLLHRCH